MWRESLAIAGSLVDDLVAGVGQAVQGTVAEDSIVEQAEPFVHGPVAGDDETGDRWRLRMSSYRSADCWAVSRCSPKSSRMSRSGDRKDRKMRSTELSTRGLGHGFEEVISVAEAHGVSGADSGIAESLSEEALPHAGWSHQQHVLVLVQKLGREYGVQQTAVQGN